MNSFLNDHTLPEYTGPFRDVIPKYLLYREAQGLKYSHRLAQQLRRMDNFFHDLGIEKPAITREAYEAYTARDPSEKKGTAELRRSAIRPFARYLESLGFENIYTGYDDHRIFRTCYIPYIYSMEEISRMFSILQEEHDSQPSLGADTFRIAMLMYYCCGFRRNEVIDLHCRDIDLSTGRITILEGKNNVSRIVVASDSLLAELNAYVQSWITDVKSDEYFLYPGKTRKAAEHCIYNGLKDLFVKAEICPRPDGTGPRLHDFRHTFCVRTLEQMQTKGFDLYTSLPWLTTYLGHSRITHTEYYLRLLEDHFEGILSQVESYSPDLYSSVEGGDDE